MTEQATLTFTRVYQTSQFGPRQMSWGPDFHLGTDASNNDSYPISGLGDGTVILAGRDPNYSPGGISVIIEHAPGIRTRYNSLSKLNVVVGQKVRSGDIIGWAGVSAPGATGAHCHYGLMLEGQYVDPLWVWNPGTVQKWSGGYWYWDNGQKTATKRLIPGQPVTVYVGEPDPEPIQKGIPMSLLPINYMVTTNGKKVQTWARMFESGLGIETTENAETCRNWIRDLNLDPKVVKSIDDSGAGRRNAWKKQIATSVAAISPTMTDEQVDALGDRIASQLSIPLSWTTTPTPTE